VSDPARTLALLWRTEDPAPKRGRRPGLTVDGVVAAALTIADAEGLDTVTMRRIAQELGVVPMTLYTYVPGKAELLDLMLDAVYGAMPRPDLTELSWRDRLTAIAEANRALYAEHPWAAGLSWSRPPLGPGLVTKYEYELHAFDGLGLGDVDRDASLTFLLAFVQSWAQGAADAARASAEMSDEAWWAEHEPLLSRILDPANYPLAVRVGEAAGAELGAAFSPGHAWRFGLARVLDGLAALVTTVTDATVRESPGDVGSCA
jgi:AcrR family transcriptional regulator